MAELERPDMMTMEAAIGTIEELLVSKRLSRFIESARKAALVMGLKRHKITVSEPGDGTVHMRFEAFADG